MLLLLNNKHIKPSDIIKHKKGFTAHLLCDTDNEATLLIEAMRFSVWVRKQRHKEFYKDLSIELYDLTDPRKPDWFQILIRVEVINENL